MKKIAPISLFSILLFSIIPLPVFAHEQQTFEIGGALYHFTIGSLNEPVMVDDKTGVDLRVAKISAHAMSGGSTMSGMDMAGMDHGTSAETAVTGLEKTVRVELKTDGVSKVMDLQPVYGSVGAYKAPYYPTRPMQITYRIFGTIDGNPVDVSFSCNPAGHDMSTTTEHTDRVDLGNGVVRVSQKGAFGCPVARDTVTFPDTVPSSYSSGDDMKTAFLLSGVALVAALAALAITVRRTLQRKTAKQS